MNLSLNCSQCHRVNDCIGRSSSSYIEQLINEEKKVVQFAKGELLFRSNFKANYIYIIRMGVVKVFQTSSEGESIVLDLVDGGSILGYDSINRESVYQNSAMALVDVNACLFSVEFINNIIVDNPDVCKYLFKETIRSKNRLLDRIEDLSIASAEIRLARIIIRLFQNCHEQYQSGMEIKRTELAEIAGLSRETVSRVLTYFITQKYLKFNGKKIIVSDLNKFKQLAKL